MTDLNRELEIQSQWHLLPQCQHLKIFNELVNNEFLPERLNYERQWRLLKNIIRFASRKIPFYKKKFSQVGIHRLSLDSLKDLSILPILTKSDIQNNSSLLRPSYLPPGEKFSGETRTSGSTGQPVRVPHTEKSMIMFGVLKQREFRWFRFDPRLTLAVIRPTSDVPSQKPGEKVKLGQTISLNGWLHVRRFFKTGSFIGFIRSNPLDVQRKWLEKNQPHYLIIQPADLEHLALSYHGKRPPGSLKASQVISQDLTAEMRSLIKRTFNVPLYQNYGLNEIGIIATRCTEGKRYHVHTEHCLVEIVDEAGNPCLPGQQGKVVVTALNNKAMPLIRYDTDDLAEVVDGPCPCGRTLPSFVNLRGRYKRIISLPKGTMAYSAAFQRELSDMPQDLLNPLRQYQLHQSADRNFSLRLVVAGKLPPQFQERLQKAWLDVQNEHFNATLNIKIVDSIPRPPGGKYQNFTSDFMPM